LGGNAYRVTGKEFTLKVAIGLAVGAALICTCVLLMFIPIESLLGIRHTHIWQTAGLEGLLSGITAAVFGQLAIFGPATLDRMRRRKGAKP
jgi:hypothetical protein